MKAVLIFILTLKFRADQLLNKHNEDIIANRRALIIYADNVPKEIINEKKPVLNSWRKNMLEVRNMCKIIECNYAYFMATNFPNRFISNKCYIENNFYCES